MKCSRRSTFRTLRTEPEISVVRGFTVTRQCLSKQGCLRLKPSLVRVLVLAIWGLELACLPTRFCGENHDTLKDAQGQAYGCVVAETCPRPDNAVVCLNNGIPEVPCIACESSACAEISPVRCE